MHSSLGLKMFQTLFKAIYKSMAFNSYNNPRTKVLWLNHFIDSEAETQRSEVTDSKSHSGYT